MQWYSTKLDKRKMANSWLTDFHSREIGKFPDNRLYIGNSRFLGQLYVHLYCYYQLQPRVISNDFHWLKWDEYVTRNGIPLSGDTLFPRACAALIIAVSWVWPLGGREFGRWSRQRLFSNILSDPVQIWCTLTSWLKACGKHFQNEMYKLEQNVV